MSKKVRDRFGRRLRAHAVGVFFLAVMAALGGRTQGANLDPTQWTAGDVGTVSQAGATETPSGAVVMTAAGAGIGFKSDAFHFAAAPAEGDFDIRVRVAALKPTDLWAKAGLMLRSERSAAAPFAGVFATPSGAGCLFQSRDAQGGNAASQGYFRANQPFTWLRLTRVGDLVSGYAGYDGRRWSRLGTKTLSWGTNALLGLAVASHGTNATHAEFRDLGLAVDAVTQAVPVDVEPLGPSSRRTAMVVSEIMYHPAADAQGRELEFVELYNSQPYYEDISGWKLAGDIEFTFPAGTIVPGGGFLVVAKAPTDLQAAYGIEGVLGPYEGKLNNAGGTLRLTGDHQAVFLEVTFDNRYPWPKQADGGGHSLVLARPSYGEADPRAWGASRIKGGSPGLPEAVELTAARGLRINECQLPDAAGAGFVELFNAGADETDIGGVRLGRAGSTLPFAAPVGTRLKPGAFLAFTWTQLGFSLGAGGGTLYLESADGSRLLDAATFGPQAAQSSAGRWPNGGTAILPLPEPTPGTGNTRPRPEVTISEVHHSPQSGDSDEEFVELYNGGAAAVDLSSWELSAGVSFAFPPGTALPAGGYLVVAHNAQRLQQIHTNLQAGQIVGDFKGKLSGQRERLVLSRPITIQNEKGSNETVQAAVCEAAFSGSGRWNRWSDKGGSTLELTDLRAHPGLSANWADSDETARAEWTVVEATGVLDNGPATSGGGGFPGGGGGFPGGGGGGGSRTMAPDSLHIVLMGEGECLIDNVEVIGTGATNRLANGTFESGVTGWTFSGNHLRSTLETGAGYESGQSLHLRASGNGDTGANKIYAKLTAALTTNTTATLRARVKWLRGWPEILLRLRGNYLEAFGRLAMSPAPGTPGARNSRAVANAGPAIAEVTHFPVVPATDEPVVVSALVDDPDGVESVTLRYRTDPDTAWTSVAMRDDGTGGDAVPGDGIYAGTIPAPGAAKLIAFTLEAKDRASASASTVFPPNAPSSVCLVRFGDGVQSGAFGTYRLWVTQADAATWKSRPVLSNEPIESTFVYGDVRPVYNAGGRFAGSPYHQQFTEGPNSAAHFVVEFPGDDRLLGATAFNKLHAPGNGAFDDTSLQREQVVYWLARQSQLPWLHRRYFHFYVNGSKKQTLMEDTQVGSDDLVEEYWPEDTQGDLYKLQPWFEFSDTVSQSLNFQSSTFWSLNRYTTTGNQLKLARYRWNWLVRGAEDTANDYTNALALVLAATDTANPAYAAQVEEAIDLDEWMKAFAINHAVGNWDSVGYKNQQNTYSYKPRDGRWELIIWDANIALGGGNSDGPSSLPLFTTTDPILTKWFNGGAFKRRYRTALYELVNGPYQVGRIAPLLDAKYASFQEHGVTAASPETIKTWITSARSYIIAQIAKDTAPFTLTNQVQAGSWTLSGTGPLDMVALQVNDTPVAVTWTSTQAWTAQYTPASTTHRYVIAAVNRQGQTIAGAVAELTTATPVGATLTLVREGAGLRFVYPATHAGTFRLQSALSLTNPSWQTVTEQSSATGAVEFRLDAPSPSALFYRVLEL